MSIEKERTGCPCTWTEPCGYACSCARPVMSGGCLCCCSHGSDEQRAAKAEWLSKAIVSSPVLLQACEAILKDDEEFMADDGQMYPEYLADRLNQIREAVAKARGTAA